MEQGEVDPPPSTEEQFWEALPWYLSYGMTAEEFWRGDPKLAESYREAFKIQKERKNQELWLQGLYFLKALDAAINGEKAPYPDEPVPLTKEAREVQEQREQESANASFEAAMMSFASSVNKKFEKRGEAKNGR